MVCMVNATDAVVDGESHVRFAKKIAADDSEFRRETEASIWHQDHTVH